MRKLQAFSDPPPELVQPDKKRRALSADRFGWGECGCHWSEAIIEDAVQRRMSPSPNTQQVPFGFAQGRLSPGFRPVRNDILIFIGFRTAATVLLGLVRAGRW